MKENTINTKLHSLEFDAKKVDRSCNSLKNVGAILQMRKSVVNQIVCSKEDKSIFLLHGIFEDRK